MNKVCLKRLNIKMLDLNYFIQSYRNYEIKIDTALEVKIYAL